MANFNSPIACQIMGKVSGFNCCSGEGSLQFSEGTIGVEAGRSHIVAEATRLLEADE